MARANPAVSRTVFNAIQSTKEWHSISGGHFWAAVLSKRTIFASMLRAGIILQRQMFETTLFPLRRECLTAVADFSLWR